MAMTGKAWMGLAVVACAAIGVTYLPPTGHLSRQRAPASAAQVRMQVAERTIRRLTAEHGIARWRDAAVTWADRVPGDSLLIAGSATGPDTGRIRRIVEEEWSQVGTAHPRVRPVAVLVTDTAVMIGRLRVNPPTDVTLAAQGAGGPYCLYLMASLGPEWDRWQRLAVRRGLGPCAFRAMYGPPGPAIDHWLAARGYDLAGTTLLSAAGGHVPPPRASDVRSSPLLRMLGVQFEGEGLSLAGWACVRRNAARCADAVLDPRPDGAPPPSAEMLRAWRPAPPRDFGGVESNFLADLAREIGPARFEPFWQSDTDVAVAFQAAAGRPIGEWTRDWAARRVRPELTGTSLAGVGVDGRDAALALIVAAAFGLAGALLAVRRQVR